MAASRRFFVFLFIALILGVTGLLLSCGGGGGSGSSVGVTGSSGSGSVALMLADGPADDYQNIWMSVLEVILLPADGSALHPVTIFRSSDPEGYEFDLLDLRDQDFLLTVKDNIPSGTYSKIRLKINTDRIIAVPKEGIDAECGNNMGDLQIKLPSGKIDLNPRGGIPVRAGETLAIRLDIDANKSIQLHSAGNSGKCIFRPVVFVDIEPVFVPDRCPRMLKGIINRLYTDNGQTIGFELVLGEGRNPLHVYIDSQTIIFDEDAIIVGPEAFLLGDPVNVRGFLDGEGELLASLVVIGEVIKVKGIVTEDVNEEGVFIVDPEPGESIIGDPLPVALAPETAIFSGCDTPVIPDNIEAGMGVRLFGKLEVTNGVIVFKAVAVFLTPSALTGTITDVVVPAPEHEGSITLDGSIFIGVPYDVNPYLVGDGEVPWSLIETVVGCEPFPRASVELAPGTGENRRASAIDILPEVLDNATIETISLTDRLITTTSGQTIYVQPGAFILLSTSGADTPVSLSSFEIGDTILVHGIEGCGGPDPDFYGFILFRVMT